MAGGERPVEVAISIVAGEWRRAAPDIEQHVEAAVRAAVAGAQSEAAAAAPGTDVGLEISVALADDAFVRRLNEKHRGRPVATNVLSFPLMPDPSEPVVAAAGALLGDLVLAYETVAAEARSQGKSVRDHTSHLVVHGALHLLGYDHEADSEAERMEMLETAVLAGLGIADPYATPHISLRAPAVSGGVRSDRS